MVKANYPSNLYLNPRFTIDRMEGLIQKHGAEKALTNTKYKAEREAWVTAMFALGLTKMTRKIYWVGINPEDSTPDTYLIALAEGARGTIKETLSVEVMEWESHSKNSLQDAIRRKMQNKKYPDYFNLLCYGHSRPGETVNTEQIYKEFQSEQFNVGEVWLLANIQSTDDNYLAIKLFPERGGVTFTKDEALQPYKDLPEMIQADRGNSGKDGVRSIRYLPLPD